MPAPYRVYPWMALLLAISWLSLVLLDPQPAGGREYRLGYFLGSLFAHATLAAAWAALGPGRIVWRVPLSLAWVATLPITIAIVISMHGGPDDAPITLGGCLLLQWILLQGPLWAIMLGLHLQLFHRSELNLKSGLEQIRFGIRHLLMIMAVVGVLLGVGRVVLPMVDLGGQDGPIFAFLAIAAVLLMLPLLLAALMPRFAIAGVVMALIFIGVATTWELPLFEKLGGSGPDTEDFVGINVAQAVLVLLSALILRLNGYRLDVRPTDRQIVGGKA